MQKKYHSGPISSPCLEQMWHFILLLERAKLLNTSHTELSCFITRGSLCWFWAGFKTINQLCCSPLQRDRWPNKHVISATKGMGFSSWQSTILLTEALFPAPHLGSVCRKCQKSTSPGMCLEESHRIRSTWYGPRRLRMEKEWRHQVSYSYHAT